MLAWAFGEDDMPAGNAVAMKRPGLQDAVSGEPQVAVDSINLLGLELGLEEERQFSCWADNLSSGKRRSRKVGETCFQR